MKRKLLSYSAFLKRVNDTIKQNDMLHKGDRVLAAVSGGPDSVCLLRALLVLRGDYKLKIVVGNVDHGIRGKVSEMDSVFVKELAKKYGLRFVHKKINVKNRKKKISTEECAREKRYLFLMESAARCNCNVIATGHTMDDQAETVIMRVISGTSLAGITGIPPVRFEGTKKIIRPLIRLERRDIIDFIGETGLRYVKDHTNLDTRILRNAIRLKVLPFLERYNPRLKRSLANLADTVREDFLLLNSIKGKMLSKVLLNRRSQNSIKLEKMISQPVSLQKEVFKELFKRSGGNIKKLTYRHWLDTAYFLKSAAKGCSLDLPGNVRIIKKKDEIIFSKRRKI